jgi:hypothetical protein
VSLPVQRWRVGGWVSSTPAAILPSCWLESRATRRLSLSLSAGCAGAVTTWRVALTCTDSRLAVGLSPQEPLPCRRPHRARQAGRSLKQARSFRRSRIQGAHMAGATAVAPAARGTADPIRAVAPVGPVPHRGGGHPHRAAGHARLHTGRGGWTPRSCPTCTRITSAGSPCWRAQSCWSQRRSGSSSQGSAQSSGGSSASTSRSPGHTAGSMSLLIRRRERSPLLLVGDLTYGAELLLGGPGSRHGGRRQLVETTRRVLALKETIPDLVILPAHDPTASQRLLERGSWR